MESSSKKGAEEHVYAGPGKMTSQPWPCLWQTRADVLDDNAVA